MGILDQLITDMADDREKFYANTEIWDTEFDDPMAAPEPAPTYEQPAHARCGRCGHATDPDKISVTGPYRTCPPCTQIIRN